MTLPVDAQTLTVRTVSDALHVRASGLGFIAGSVLDRLQDGRSVRVDFDLMVLDKPNGAIITRVQQGFNLSFDLWEQRFAVTRIGPMPRSISHLTARAVGYRIQDRASTAAPEDSTFTLQTLIDVLSRRREDENRGKSVEAGPFRLSN
jgi:hypothetical protein